MMMWDSSDELLFGQHVFDSNVDEPRADLQAVLSLVCTETDSEYAADKNIEREREHLDWDCMLFESKDIEGAMPACTPGSFYEVDATASTTPVKLPGGGNPVLVRRHISDPGEELDEPQLPRAGDGSIATGFFEAPDFDAPGRPEIQLDAWLHGTSHDSCRACTPHGTMSDADADAHADADGIDYAVLPPVLPPVLPLPPVGPPPPPPHGAAAAAADAEGEEEVDWSDCDPAQLHAKLLSMFHLSRRAVCEAVGFSSTTFKMRCRDLGISRWPARKLQSIEFHAASLVALQEAAAADLETADGEIIAAYIRDVEALKERIYIFPDHPIPSFVRQMAKLKRELKRTNLQKRRSREFATAPSGRGKAARSPRPRACC
jgi:hypothetical protein